MLLKNLAQIDKVWAALQAKNKKKASDIRYI